MYGRHLKFCVYEHVSSKRTEVAIPGCRCLWPWLVLDLFQSFAPGQCAASEIDCSNLSINVGKAVVMMAMETDAMCAVSDLGRLSERDQPLSLHLGAAMHAQPCSHAVDHQRSWASPAFVGRRCLTAGLGSKRAGLCQ